MSRTERPAWTPTDSGGLSCRNCGEHVLEQTARVFGDNRDRLWHCNSCVSLRDLAQGAGTDPDYDPSIDRGQSSENHPIFPGAGGEDQ